MKTYKTRQDQRGNYTYNFLGLNGKEKKVTINPGENGVTKEHIKLLHALDDSEVYYNNKNSRPERTKEEKAEIKRWKKEYIEKVIEERRYVPTDDELKAAVEERFPRNYNLSLDYDFGLGDEEADLNKSRLMYEVALIAQKEESLETLRVRELISEMPEKQRKAITLTALEGHTLQEAGEIMGISAKNVKKHRDNAKKYIKENFYK